MSFYKRFIIENMLYRKSLKRNWGEEMLKNIQFNKIILGLFIIGIIIISGLGVFFLNLLRIFK